MLVVLDRRHRRLRCRNAPLRTLFRAENEIRDLDSRVGRDDTGQYVCECADDGCVERLSVPVDGYVAVRRDPRRFIVAPGHEDLALETVVEQHERYVVVEKVGTPGEIAERLDKRPD